MFWGVTILATVAYVYSRGQEFTDSPKLVHQKVS